MDTETHADWACGNCDEFQQLFMYLDETGVWQLTTEAQEMVAFHMNGRCA